MKTSPIGWTDYSGGDLNFVIRGKDDCRISEGCAHCYVDTWNHRWGGHKLPDVTTFYPDKLERLRHKKFPQYSPRRGAPHRPMAFVVDMGDLFHERVPSDFISAAFDVFRDRPDVIWQVLTKRPERMLQEARRWCESNNVKTLLANVWAGVTVENAARLRERYPLLELTPAKTKFLSIEPMLEPMAETPYMACALDTVDWVICGAESGPHRRPFDVQWAVDLYEVCQSNCKPFFGKQDSALYPGEPLVLPGYGVVQEWPGGGRRDGCAVSVSA